MRVVELADINKVIDDKSKKLLDDPLTKQSQYANEVAVWAAELLAELKNEITQYAGEVKVINRRRM